MCIGALKIQVICKQRKKKKEKEKNCVNSKKNIYA